MKLMLLIICSLLWIFSKVLDVFTTLLAIAFTVIDMALNELDWSLQMWMKSIRNRPDSGIAWSFWHFIALCSIEPAALKPKGKS